MLVITLQAGYLTASACKNTGDTSEACVIFSSTFSQDPTSSVDPNFDKDVAATSVFITPDQKNVLALISNAYPGYQPVITALISNCGNIPVYICGISAESSSCILIEYRFPEGIKLKPGETKPCLVTAGIHQLAEENHLYSFKLTLNFCQLFTGSPGFWEHINRNKQFTEEQIESWLCQIDDSSSFLGPRTFSDMLAFFHKKSSDAQTNFLKQYLAMRLNLCAGLLEMDETHDLSGIDTSNYLGLSNPENASLEEIISAIENKYGTFISRHNYLIMKSVCEKINNYEI